MMQYYFFLFLLFFFYSLTSSISANEKFIVSTEWLAQHLNDKNLIILQIGNKDAFYEAHIPGSDYISYDDFAPENNGLHRQMPTIEKLVSLFEKYGISNNSRIVLYTDRWITPTSRLYLTLDYVGLGDQTSILDGGITKWQNENRPVTKETIKRKRGKIIPKLKDIIVNKDYLLKVINDPSTTIIDARTEDYYSASAEMNHYSRPGHITGAYNIQFNDLTSEEVPYLFKSEDKLRKYFEDAFVKKENTTVAYCHIGQQATLVYFVGKMLGYNMKLYDGSFEEWSADENCPVTGKLKIKRN